MLAVAFTENKRLAWIRSAVGLSLNLTLREFFAGDCPVVMGGCRGSEDLHASADCRPDGLQALGSSGCDNKSNSFVLGVVVQCI